MPAYQELRSPGPKKSFFGKLAGLFSRDSRDDLQSRQERQESIDNFLGLVTLQPPSPPQGETSRTNRLNNAGTKKPHTQPIKTADRTRAQVCPDSYLKVPTQAHMRNIRSEKAPAKKVLASTESFQNDLRSHTSSSSTSLAVTTSTAGSEPRNKERTAPIRRRKPVPIRRDPPPPLPTQTDKETSSPPQHDRAGLFRPRNQFGNNSVAKQVHIFHPLQRHRSVHVVVEDASSSSPPPESPSTAAHSDPFQDSHSDPFQKVSPTIPTFCRLCRNAVEATPGSLVCKRCMSCAFFAESPAFGPDGDSDEETVPRPKPPVHRIDSETAFRAALPPIPPAKDSIYVSVGMKYPPKPPQLPPATQPRTGVLAPLRYTAFAPPSPVPDPLFSSPSPYAAFTSSAPSSHSSSRQTRDLTAAYLPAGYRYEDEGDRNPLLPENPFARSFPPRQGHGPLSAIGRPRARTVAHYDPDLRTMRGRF